MEKDCSMNSKKYQGENIYIFAILIVGFHFPLMLFSSKIIMCIDVAMTDDINKILNE